MLLADGLNKQTLVQSWSRFLHAKICCELHVLQIHTLTSDNCNNCIHFNLEIVCVSIIETIEKGNIYSNTVSWSLKSVSQLLILHPIVWWPISAYSVEYNCVWAYINSVFMNLLKFSSLFIEVLIYVHKSLTAKFFIVFMSLMIVGITHMKTLIACWLT